MLSAVFKYMYMAKQAVDCIMVLTVN